MQILGMQADVDAHLAHAQVGERLVCAPAEPQTRKTLSQGGKRPWDRAALVTNSSAGNCSRTIDHACRAHVVVGWSLRVGRLWCHVRVGLPSRLPAPRCGILHAAIHRSTNAARGHVRSRPERLWGVLSGFVGLGLAPVCGLSRLGG